MGILRHSRAPDLTNGHYYHSNNEATTLNTMTSTQHNQRIFVPILALSLYAIASGYMMSLLPILVNNAGMDSSVSSWLASAFYLGLLIGAIVIEQVLKRFDHKHAFIVCLSLFSITILAIATIVSPYFWVASRLIAGIAVAGIFVIVESWLMSGEAASRSKRLSLYMIALYGGSALGQLGMSIIDSLSYWPFVSVIAMNVMAIAVLILIPSQAPRCEHTLSLSFDQIKRLNHAAIIGCIVSGLMLGAVYGLLPVEMINRNIDEQTIGKLMSLVILGGMAVQPIASAFSGKIPKALLMAFFCLLGLFAIGLTLFNTSIPVFAVALFLLGMASFALYPVAIDLGCETLSQEYMVSAAQVMLLSYSVGSVFGPIVAEQFMGRAHGLMDYLFVILLATAIYMLLVAAKKKPSIIAH